MGDGPKANEAMPAGVDGLHQFIRLGWVIGLSIRGQSGQSQSTRYKEVHTSS